MGGRAGVQGLATTGPLARSMFFFGSIEVLNRARVRRVLISAHDSDDHAIGRMDAELEAEVEILKAGRTYDLA